MATAKLSLPSAFSVSTAAADFGVARGDRHARAGPSQALGHAEAQAAVAAGDQRDLAAEVEHQAAAAGTGFFATSVRMS